MRFPLTMVIFPEDYTVCQVPDFSQVHLDRPCSFTAYTGEEYSLVCRTSDVPIVTTAREDSWRLMKIDAVLDFSLIGILADISSLLAARGISIFAVSTFNTDYILVRSADLAAACTTLREGGAEIDEPRTEREESR